MNKVVLFAESSLSYQHGKPLGIYVLASYLRSHNIKTQTICAWRYIDDKMFEKLCRKFLSDATVVVGISSTLLSTNESSPEDRVPKFDFFGMPADRLRKKLSMIKWLAPNAKIVVGGSQTLYHNLNNIPGAELVDLYIKGQGEEMLLKLAQGESLKTVSLTPAVTSDTIYGYDKFTTTPVQYHDSDCIAPNEGLSIELARGCVFKCSFCSYFLNGKHHGDYVKQADTLRQEFINNYEKHGTTHYIIVDDLINDSEEKVNMLLEVSQSLPFKLQYSGYLRLDLIRRFPSMAQKLKDSGLIACFFGLETIDSKSGRTVGKGLGMERIEQGLEICHEAWGNTVLITAAFIMGLPSHDSHTKHELLNWLNQMRSKKMIHEVRAQPLFINVAVPNSEIDKNPEKFGYKIDKSNQNNITWVTDDYSFEQATQDCDYVLSEFYKNYKFKNRPGTFRLPFVLSLVDADTQHAIINLLMNDSSSMWADSEEWNKYLNNLHYQFRQDYFTRLLEYQEPIEPQYQFRQDYFTKLLEYQECAEP